MAIVIRYMYCLVFISRSSDLIQYGGIVTKADMRECEHEDVHLLHSAGLVKNRGQIVKKSHQSSENRQIHTKFTAQFLTLT